MTLDDKAVALAEAIADAIEAAIAEYNWDGSTKTPDYAVKNIAESIKELWG